MQYELEVWTCVQTHAPRLNEESKKRMPLIPFTKDDDATAIEKSNEILEKVVDQLIPGHTVYSAALRSGSRIVKKYDFFSSSRGEEVF